MSLLSLPLSLSCLSRLDGLWCLSRSRVESLSSLDERSRLGERDLERCRADDEPWRCESGERDRVGWDELGITSECECV